MRLLILLLVSCAGLAAQTITVQVPIVFQDDNIPVIRRALEIRFLEQADTNTDGSVTGAEALAWFTEKLQEEAKRLEKFSIGVCIDEGQLDVFSTRFRDAQTAYDAALAVREAEKALLLGEN